MGFFRVFFFFFLWLLDGLGRFVLTVLEFVWDVWGGGGLLLFGELVGDLVEDTFVALFMVVFWRFSRVLDGFGAVCLYF